MTPQEATTAVIDALEALGIPYMLVGSHAGNFYGISRAMGGIDFVVQMQGVTLWALVPRLGPQFQLNPQTTFDTAAAGRHVLEAADKSVRVELYPLTDDAHDLARFARRRREPMLEREVPIPSAEDVIITKLRWSHQGRRSKDVNDAQNVVALQGDRIDWDYVTGWCDRHGTRELLNQVRQCSSGR